MTEEKDNRFLLIDIWHVSKSERFGRPTIRKYRGYLNPSCVPCVFDCGCLRRLRGAVSFTERDAVASAEEITAQTEANLRRLLANLQKPIQIVEVPYEAPKYEPIILK